MVVAWTRVVIVGVGGNGRIVHLFWYILKDVLTDWTWGGRKTVVMGDQGRDSWEDGFQDLGWVELWQEQAWGNVRSCSGRLCWRCLGCLSRSLGRHLSKGSEVQGRVRAGDILLGLPGI